MFKFRAKNFYYLTSFSVIILFLFFASPFLRSSVLTALKYPLKLFMLVNREIGGVIFFHRNLVQNERLKKEIDSLKHKLNESKEISSENSRLRELLAFKQRSSYKTIAAKVSARSLDNWSSVIIIDKGQANGIKRGFVAVTYLGLVGRVIETTKSTSKIMLINDPDLGVSAMVQRTRQEGLVSGTLSNSLIMKYLPQNADLKISDTVVTSGLTDTFPEGILIGAVIGVHEELSGLSHNAIIKPAVELSSLEEVLVIIP